MQYQVVAMAIGPSILHSGLSQPEASGPANSILISSSAKSYKCTTRLGFQSNYDVKLKNSLFIVVQTLINQYLQQ